MFVYSRKGREEAIATLITVIGVIYAVARSHIKAATLSFPLCYSRKAAVEMMNFMRLYKP